MSTLGRLVGDLHFDGALAWIRCGVECIDSFREWNAVCHKGLDVDDAAGEEAEGFGVLMSAGLRGSRGIMRRRWQGRARRGGGGGTCRRWRRAERDRGNRSARRGYMSSKDAQARLASA